MNRDQEHFNCSEKHELEYVVYKKYKRLEKTSPSSSELKTFIQDVLCKKYKNMTHEFLYSEIEKKYPVLKKV